MAVSCKYTTTTTSMVVVRCVNDRLQGTPHENGSKIVCCLARPFDHDQHAPQQCLHCYGQSQLQTVSFRTDRSKPTIFCSIPIQTYRYFPVTAILQKKTADSSVTSLTCTSLTQRYCQRCLLWLVLIALSKGTTSTLWYKKSCLASLHSLCAEMAVKRVEFRGSRNPIQKCSRMNDV